MTKNLIFHSWTKAKTKKGIKISEHDVEVKGRIIIIEKEIQNATVIKNTLSTTK